MQRSGSEGNGMHCVLGRSPTRGRWMDGWLRPENSSGHEVHMRIACWLHVLRPSSGTDAPKKGRQTAFQWLDGARSRQRPLRQLRRPPMGAAWGPAVHPGSVELFGAVGAVSPPRSAGRELSKPGNGTPLHKQARASGQSKQLEPNIDANGTERQDDEQQALLI